MRGLRLFVAARVCNRGGVMNENKRIRFLDYLRVVYPVVEACFVGYQAHPDGKQYDIYNLYTGIFRDDDGRMRFRVTPIWFCVQPAPAPEKK